MFNKIKFYNQNSDILFQQLSLLGPVQSGTVYFLGSVQDNLDLGLKSV